MGGECACVVERPTGCVLDTDCASGLVCRAGTCLEECISDRDCAFGARCVAGRCASDDASTDAPVLDASLDARDAGVAVLPDVESVSAGQHHTCAISSGMVWCWGNFEWEVPPSVIRHYPPRPMGLAATRVVTSPTARHVCAIDTSGGLHCLGVNTNGVVGDGSMVTRETFVAVTGLASDVRDVAVGVKHTCAILGDEVWCWGNALDGALGDGRMNGVANEPVNIGLNNAVDIAAGQDTTCAVRGDGSLWCWGSNNRGRSGLGVLDRALVPTEVPLSFAVRSVAMSPFRGCVVAEDDTVHCWGLDFGPLFDLRVPTEMVGVRALSVAVGFAHICGVTPDNQARCWGEGSSGQLGHEDAPSYLDVPGALVVGLDGVDAVVAGHGHSCARTSGQLWCWGFNDRGQLGAGHRASTHVPVPVLAP